MLELLFLVLGVYWIGERFGEEAESWAIAILVICLLIALIVIGRGSDRAYGNFVRYWRDGGPDRRDKK